MSRLDKAIRRKYGKHIPQSVIEKAIRNRDILVNGNKASSSQKVSDTDDEIFVHEAFIRSVSTENKEKNVQTDNPEFLLKQFKDMIIYEDANIIAINKPSGIAVQLGTSTKISIDVMAKTYHPEARLVHRIDKQTSGITILSKTLSTSRYMLHLFKTKGIHKRYLAIISSKNLKDSHGVINVPLLKDNEHVVVDKYEGKKAITEYTVLKNLEDDLAIVEAILKTGRTHQIRVHMQYIGCPILGDSKYGGRRFKHLCLHAHKVSFVDIDNKKISITAQPPEYIKLD